LLNPESGEQGTDPITAFCCFSRSSLMRMWKTAPSSA